MPANPASLQITDRYREQLLQIRQRTMLIAAGQWNAMTFEDLNRSYARWLDLIATLVAGAQRYGARLTVAYLAAFIGSELGELVTPPAIDPDVYAGRSRDDRPLVEALTPPLYTVKMALAQRKTPAQASLAGLNRALRLVASETVAAPRAALADAIKTDRRLVGWRRVTSGNACGACLGAATGAIHKTDVVLDVHDHCRCTAEPVVRGVRERVHRRTGKELFDGMSPSQQDVLFHGRGGADKADLIRSGTVSLEDLVTRSPMQRIPDQITETPLEALTH